MTAIIAEGKTKQIFVPTDLSPESVEIESKDIVTWGNTNSAPMPGKGIWSTTTIANNFRVLEEAGLPVAFEEQVSPTRYRAPRCTMLPLEVVARCVIDAKSSFLKRNPGAEVGDPFNHPPVEFFLKTSGKNFRGIELPDDDPYINTMSSKGIYVFHPGEPVRGTGIFIPHSVLEWHGRPWPESRLRHYAQHATEVLRDSWARLGYGLRDIKFEFGYDHRGRLLIADGISNDEWRILGPDGKECSKQNVRNGMPLEEAARYYEQIAKASEHLRL